VPNQDAAAVRAQHAPAVLANQVRADARWNMPCLAFIVIAGPDQATAGALAAVQRQIAPSEPGLLAVPPTALHMSAARLLPVDGDDQAKQAVWARRGKEWMAALRTRAARMQPADIVLEELIATNAAVIAAGQAPAWVGDLRAAVADLTEVGGNISSGGLAHLTLFRYSGRLADPTGLLDALNGLKISVTMAVADLLVIREVRFPCLDYQVLDTLPCGPCQAGQRAAAGQPGQPPVTAR
jgi:hypothetical protein